MGTLSSLYDLSRGALLADQAALDVTSNNVANQNTAGYVRQVATFNSGDTVTLSNGSVQYANSPSERTSSARDLVLEGRIQQQTQAQSATAARAAVYTQLESVFSISGSSASAGSTALGSSLDTFFSSLTALASNPSNPSSRQTVLADAQVVASAFNAASAQVSSLSSSLRTDLSSSVDQVNQLTSTIAKLNLQISETSPNTDAGTLEDQRQAAITQLSQYIGLDQIKTENNGISLSTTGGVPLVSSGTSFSLTAVNTGNTVEIRDSSGTDQNANITGGSIGGQLQAQNTDVPAVSSALDTLAYRFATAVNVQNQAGSTPSGSAGSAIFNLSSTSTGAATAMSMATMDVSQLASAGANEGTTGNSNALALAALATTATDSSGNTFDQSLAGLLSGIGTNSAALATQNTNQTAMLNDLVSQRDTLSGVSLDTEAANLSQYQRSYEAAAKMFTILDQIMASALNLGQQTTVS